MPAPGMIPATANRYWISWRAQGGQSLAWGGVHAPEVCGHSDIVVSKLGLISKPRRDGTMQHRFIWDLRRSGVNQLIQCPHRIIRPPVSDVVQDNLTLRGPACTRQPTMIGIVITNTFHLIPLHARERRFTCTVLHETIYRFTSRVPGAKSAPTLWGRYATFLGRATQAAVRQ